MISKLVTWVFLAILCSFIIKIMLLLDLNKRVFNHVPGPCKLVKGVDSGSEDIELLPDGIALISSGLVYGDNKVAGSRGKIFLFDFESKISAKSVETLKIDGANFDKENFHPHGLSSYTSRGKSDGRLITTLYAVNHRPDGDTVECFTFNKQKRTLTHTKTIRDSHIYSANDLVVVGPDKFYITNDHYFKNKWMRKLEMFLMISLGNVVYYDGKARFVDQWMLTPNGIGVEKKHKHLYVAQPLQETIKIYNISGDMSLIKHSEISILTAPDNIFVDPETGDLWTGNHPIAHKIMRHLDNPQTVSAPSQVLRIRIQGEHDRWVVTEPYANEGDTLWGSSSAVHYKQQILVGTVFHKLLHCEILNPEYV